MLELEKLLERWSWKPGALVSFHGDTTWLVYSWRTSYVYVLVSQPTLCDINTKHYPCQCRSPLRIAIENAEEIVMHYHYVALQCITNMLLPMRAGSTMSMTISDFTRLNEARGEGEDSVALVRDCRRPICGVGAGAILTIV